MTHSRARKNRRALLALTWLLVLAAAWLWAGGASPAAEARVKVIGHRGAAGLAPENTLAAFRKALDLGVDGLETDLLLTADGEVVLHHDFALNPSIARTPGGKWISGSARPLIKDLTLAQVKAYNVGRLKPGTRYSRRYPDQQPADGERIPTLRELLRLLKARNDANTRLFLEFKTSPENPQLSPPPEKLVEAAIKVLREEKCLARATFISFDWRTLAHARKIAPQNPTLYLSMVSMGLNNMQPGRPGPSPWTAGVDVDDYQGSIPKAVQAAGGRCWGPRHRSVTPELVERAHRLGLKVFPWTVDFPSDMRYLISIKVDGIITNRPDLLKQVLESEG